MRSVLMSSGAIPSDGVVSVLQRVEQLRMTGRLRFESGDVQGEVAFVAGQVSGEQPETEAGADPVETFLGLRSGRFELHQELPPLPVSRGDERARHGSLTVHVPADLMNYCERAGLTGTLRLSSSGQHAEARYVRGELVAIHLDGENESDLQRVFGWDEGRFAIEARPLEEIEPGPAVEAKAGEGSVSTAPQAPSPRDDEPTTKMRWPSSPFDRRRETTGGFLRVVEVELSRIIADRESGRPLSRSSPELPPMPSSRRPPTLPPPTAPSEPRREPTVRVVYQQAEVPAGEVEAAQSRHGEQAARPAAGQAGSHEATPAESAAEAPGPDEAPATVTSREPSGAGSGRDARPAKPREAPGAVASPEGPGLGSGRDARSAEPREALGAVAPPEGPGLGSGRDARPAKPREALAAEPSERDAAKPSGPGAAKPSGPGAASAVPAERASHASDAKDHDTAPAGRGAAFSLGSIAAATAWIIVVLVVAMGVLALLASMPQLE